MQFEMNRRRSRRIWRTSCITSREKQFYIELPENADAWETPLLLDSFVKRGETTVNSYWSKIWVQQRIVPIDRQNIGEILRDNHLKEYDEYELLMLAMGDAHRMITTLFPLTRRSFRKKLRGGSQRELKMCCRWRTIACWYFSGMA